MKKKIKIRSNQIKEQEVKQSSITTGQPRYKIN